MIVHQNGMVWSRGSRATEVSIEFCMNPKANQTENLFNEKQKSKILNGWFLVMDNNILEKNISKQDPLIRCGHMS